MTIKDKMAIAIAVFLSFASSGVWAEPSLAETTEFIANNIDGKNVKVSCNQISVENTVCYRGCDDVLLNIPVKEIDLLEHQGKKSRIIFDCITGDCIYVLNKPSGKSYRENNYDWGTKIARSRVIFAIGHLQKICGGKKSTPF